MQCIAYSLGKPHGVNQPDFRFFAPGFHRIATSIAYSHNSRVPNQHSPRFAPSTRHLIAVADRKSSDTVFAPAWIWTAWPHTYGCPPYAAEIIR